MATTTLELQIAGPLATATFRTAGGLNVLSAAVLDRVAEVAQQVAGAPDVRTLILAAEGKVFVAGADIKELAGLDAAGARAIAQRGNAAFDALEALDCITIARLHGAALGGGLEVALACDFRYAVAGVKLGLPECALGLIPGWKGISRVQALAGRGVVRRLTFGAAPVAAEEAKVLGLVDDVAADERELDAKIQARIAAVRRAGPHALAMVKQVLRGGDEVGAFGGCFAHPEAQAGMAAFAEKRPAPWMEG